MIFIGEQIDSQASLLNPHEGSLTSHNYIVGFTVTPEPDGYFYKYRVYGHSTVIMDLRGFFPGLHECVIDGHVWEGGSPRELRPEDITVWRSLVELPAVVEPAEPVYSQPYGDARDNHTWYEQCWGDDMPTPEQLQDDYAKQWPGFEVLCRNCGSPRVELNNTQGWSAESGSWGSVDFKCLDCDNTVELTE